MVDPVIQKTPYLSTPGGFHPPKISKGTEPQTSVTHLAFLGPWKKSLNGLFFPY